jgi:exosome complex component RRP4
MSLKFDDSQKAIEAKFKEFGGGKEAWDPKDVTCFVKSLFTDINSDPEADKLVGKIVENLTKPPVEKLNVAWFKSVWCDFAKTVLDPVTAFLIVDVQNDFISGSLALSNCPAGENGEQVVPVINELLKNHKFHHVFYSIDWHPKNHISFHNNRHSYKDHMTKDGNTKPLDEINVLETIRFKGPPVLDQIMWPEHCVQKSWGSELHKDLVVVEDAIKIYKGTETLIDSYSAFWDNGEMKETELRKKLVERNVTDVFICGLATDVCVNYTATHANKHFYRVVLVDDACRGVMKEGIENTWRDLSNMGSVIVNSNRVAKLATAEERPVKLGVPASLNFNRHLKSKQT